MAAFEAVGALAAKPPTCQSNPTVPKAGGGGDLVVGDVVDLEGAGVDVAQHHVGGAGSTHRAEARDLPVEPDRAYEGRAGDLVVGDVVDLEAAGLGVAHHQVGLAGHADVVDAADYLLLQSHADHEGGA